MQKKDQHNLSSLIWLTEPLEELSERLTGYNSDYSGKSVVVELVAVQTVLMRHLRGYISAPELKNWASLIYCQKGIELEAIFSRQLEEIFQFLATPDTNDSISPSLCADFLNSLGTNPSDSLIQNLAVRSEIVRVCRMMQSNRIELIYGCRRLVQLSRSLPASEQEAFLTFVGVVSECDEYPDDDKKNLFSQSYLESISRAIRLYESRVERRVLNTCSGIISEFEEHFRETKIQR
ncbi:hypothetical protein [Thalassospira sp. UBA1131]|uniref:hypothetical protein n=1 Tax=Thalassospira sp. UBA1131 TaxID=1947672 RepID=UPI0025E94F63|nr:hypothetical protein [Thalassospira sp. UBA1131]